MPSIQKILWPTDGSKSALHALEMATELAKTFNAELHALQVVSQVPTIREPEFASAGIYSRFDVSKYEQELMDIAKEMLKQTVAERVPKTVTVETHVELGSPADNIVDFARKKDIDLIVMATHGRKGIAHLMLGSVTEKTIRHSSVPVLTIPWSEAEEG